MIASSRTELCAAGLHRHIFSELSYTPLGVESLVLLGSEGERCDDFGERLLYSGCGEGERLQRALQALEMNEKRGRPVRVIRAVAAPAQSRALDGGPTDATVDPDGGVRRFQFRYDGTYSVARRSYTPACGELRSFQLVRLAGQPMLPGRDRHAAELGAGLQLFGAYTGIAPSSSLPATLQSFSIAGLTVAQALEKLRAARERILELLPAHQCYAIARQSMVNQVRLRTAIELLHGADPAPTRSLPPPPPAKRPRLETWPSFS